MGKKILSLILASLMIFSCLPLEGQAAEAIINESGSGSISITADKGESIAMIVSVNAGVNVQAMLLDMDKSYAKLTYDGYEVLDSTLNNGIVYVNNNPVDYSYTDIYASLNYPDGGKTFTAKTDILKIKFKTRAAVSNYTYNYTVKEIYDKNLNDINSNCVSLRCVSEDETQKTLSSIMLTSTPAKTTYSVGDQLNTSGMIVTASYSDQTTADVTSKVSVTGYNSNTAGTQTITVSYTEEGVTKTTTFTVKVNEITVNKITVTKLPNKTTYFKGESFDPTGLQITAEYSNSTTEVISYNSSTMTISGYSKDTVGSQNLTLIYSGKIAPFTVTVKDIEVTAIAIASNPTKTSYFVGESANYSGINVRVSYSNSTTSNITDVSQLTFSGFDSKTAGTKPITVTYRGKTATFNITVTAIAVDHIDVTVASGSQVYYTGDSFNKNGITVNAYYNNALTTAVDVTSNAAFTGFNSTNAGTCKVTASYGGKTKDFNVTIIALAINSIRIKTMPTKTVYYVGDTADYSGLVVTAIYNNGSTKDVTSGFTYSGFDTSSVGTKTVKVTYGGKEATFSITVKAKLAYAPKATVGTASYNAGSTINMKIGNTLSIEGTATGGSGSYTYTMTYKRDSDSAWTTVNSTTGKFTFNPTSKSNYTVNTVAKDSEGATVQAVFTVNVAYSDITNSSSIANLKSGDITKTCVSDNIRITGKATGGDGSYKYTYQYKAKSQSDFTTIAADTQSTTADFTISLKEDYTVRVTVKDNSSNSTVKDLSITNVGAAIANTSTVSSTQHYKGDTVTLSGAATGGDGVYKYTYYYKVKSASTWTTIAADTDNKTAAFKVDTETTYDAKVIVKDSKNRSSEKSFAVNVGPAVTYTFDDSFKNAVVCAGDTVTIKGTASGGNKSYTYTYAYKKSSDSAWTTLAANTTSFKVTDAVPYVVKVTVKDSQNREYTASMSISVGAALSNSSALNETELYQDDEFTIIGKASGGQAPYKYTYYYKTKSASDWTVVGTANTTSTEQKLKLANTGDYDYKVLISDSGNRKAEKQGTLTIKQGLSNKSTVSKDPIYIGETRTITNAAQGGSGSYTYKNYCKLSTASSWTEITNSWKPQTAGVYDIKVTVTDKATTLGSRTKTAELGKITVYAALANNSSLSLQKVQKGKSVSINGAAQGGSKNYRYRIEYTAPGSSETVVKQDYSTTSQVTLTPQTVGAYSITVKVKDVNGTNERISEKKLTLNVVEPLGITFTLSKTSIQKDQKVTLSIQGKNGIPSYSYKLTCLKPGETTPVVLQDYSTKTSFEFTPTIAGTYKFTAYVKDVNGTEVSSTKSLYTKEILTNLSTLSETEIVKNTTVKITGKSSGGVGGNKFLFEYQKPDSTEWTVKSEYGKASSVDFTPSAVGTYKIRVTVKDNNAVTAVKELSLVVRDTLKNTSTVSDTEVVKKTTISIKASSTGGIGTVKYKVSYKKPDSTEWTVKQSYGQNSYIEFTPSSVGAYTFKIEAKDEKGTVKSATKTLSVRDVLKNTSKISEKVIVKGSVVKIYASSTGGIGNVKYKVSYKKPDSTEWTVKQNYAQNTYVEFAPGSVGTYKIKVSAKDEKNTVKSAEFDLVVNDVLKNTSKLSESEIIKNTAVKINANSTGGIGEVKYRISYLKPDSTEWTEKQNYSTNKTVNMTPASIGEYTIKVEAKDSKNTVKTKELKLVVKDALTNTSSFNKSTVVKNKTVEIKASSKGGIGTIKYKISYLKPNSSEWTVKQNYSKNTFVEFTPSSSGKYVFSIEAKDEKGTVKAKTLNLNVNDTLKNTSYLSETEIVKKNTVKIKASSTGGLGTVNYKISYQKPDSSEWTVKQQYAENSFVEFTPGLTGTYNIKIEAKDKEGTVAAKTLALNVKDALKNTTVLKASEVVKGTVVPIKASSTGGVGAIQYRISYQKLGSEDWTEKQKYAQNSYVEFSPSSVGEYTIKVDAKDSKGTEKTVTLKLTVKDQLKNTSTINKTEVAKNDTVAIKASSTGGVGTVLYEISYQKPGSNDWTEKQKYSKNTYVQLTPGNVGTYTIKVDAKDGNGTVKTVTLSLNVK